jgi:hypothetical protein
MLGIFLTIREPNIRYLALDTICNFHQCHQAEKILDAHLGTILSNLRDKDISIKRRALDILYLMCGPKLSKIVVQSMLVPILSLGLHRWSWRCLQRGIYPKNRHSGWKICRWFIMVHRRGHSIGTIFRRFCHRRHLVQNYLNNHWFRLITQPRTQKICCPYSL